VLLLKRLLALENETQLRKQKKLLLERESVQLQQEKVLEEKLQRDLQKEELPRAEGDARTSYFFKLHLIRTVNLRIFYSLASKQSPFLQSGQISSVDVLLQPHGQEQGIITNLVFFSHILVSFLF